MSSHLECSVLGAFIENPDLLEAAQQQHDLDADCFSTETNRRIYSAITDLIAQDTPVDSFTVAEFCGCDPTVISTIADSVVGNVIEYRYVMAHVRMLKQRARLKALQKVGEWLQSQAGQPGADPAMLGQTAITAISEGKTL